MTDYFPSWSLCPSTDCGVEMAKLAEAVALSLSPNDLLVVDYLVRRSLVTRRKCEGTA